MNAKKVGLGVLDAIVKIVFLIIVVMLISKYSKVAYNYGYHIFNQTAVSSGTGRAVNFTVDSGDSVDTIADNLASVGLITDKTLFKLQERFSEYHGMEQPGVYELSTSMTPEEMITIMSESAVAEGEDSEKEVYEASEEENGAETSEENESDASAENAEGSGESEQETVQENSGG